MKANQRGTFFLDLLVEVVEVDGLVRGDVAGQHLLDLLGCCRRRAAEDAEIAVRAFGFGPGKFLPRARA